MASNSGTKCTVVICHSEKIKSALVEILQRMNCEICEISSLDDLFAYLHDSNFTFLEFSETSQGDLFQPYTVHTLESTPKKSSLTTESSEKSLFTVNVNNMELFQKKSNHMTLSEMEKIHITNTLGRNDWNCKTAAKQLGIDRTTLYRKIKKYGIKRDQ